jgi:hypothetical protein
MQIGERGKGNENDRVSVISHIMRFEGKGYMDMYLKLLKNGVWEVNR